MKKELTLKKRVAKEKELMKKRRNGELEKAEYEEKMESIIPDGITELATYFPGYSILGKSREFGFDWEDYYRCWIGYNRQKDHYLMLGDLGNNNFQIVRELLEEELDFPQNVHQCTCGNKFKVEIPSLKPFGEDKKSFVIEGRCNICGKTFENIGATQFSFGGNGTLHINGNYFPIVLEGEESFAEGPKTIEEFIDTYMERFLGQQRRLDSCFYYTKQNGEWIKKSIDVERYL